MERPTMVVTALGLSNRDPIADTLEVFQSDTAPGTFGLRNQPLADRMVHIGGKPRFIPHMDQICQ